jgi:hypothetical protein
MPQPSHCATCGREFKYGQVLHGWSPCKSGGHAYAYCREDTGGCGMTTYSPRVDRKRHAAASILGMRARINSAKVARHDERWRHCRTSGVRRYPGRL